MFFGAFEKYEQPLMNLLAASKRGALPNADPFDVVIVPAGLPDLHAFSRGEARHYYLNGESGFTVFEPRTAARFWLLITLLSPHKQVRRIRRSQVSSLSFKAGSTMPRAA